MKILRVKNFIGLCACEGCRKRIENRISIKFHKKGGKTINPPFNVRRFWLCDDHTWEMGREILKAGGVYENN